MTRVLQLAQVAFALAGAICFGAIAWRVLTLPAVPDLAPVVKHLDGAVMRLEGIESKANATLINVDNGTKTWSDSAKNQADSIQKFVQSAAIAVQDGRSAIGDVRTAVQTATDQEKTIGPLLTSLKSTSDTLPPLFVSLRKTSDQATVDLATFDSRLRDPEIDKIYAHIAGMAEHGDGILGSADKVAAHYEKKIDAPPTKLDRFREWAEPIGKLGIWYVTK